MYHGNGLFICHYTCTLVFPHQFAFFHSCFRCMGGSLNLFHLSIGSPNSPNPSIDLTNMWHTHVYMTPILLPSCSTTLYKSSCTVSHSIMGVYELLPPASEGWGKVLFSVCQSTPGGVPMLRIEFLVSLCVSVYTSMGGYPVSDPGRGVPGPGLGGGSQVQVQVGGS